MCRKCREEFWILQKYFRRESELFREISGRDAFAPIELLYRNQEWLEDVISLEKFQMNLE